MAQYLFSVLDETGKTATTESAAAQETAAIDAFNEMLQTEGHWVFGGGLASPDAATVVDGRGGEPMFTDGPYLESKEYVGGFWIVEAPGPDAARRLAALGSKSCNRRVEVRQILSE